MREASQARRRFATDARPGDDDAVQTTDPATMLAALAHPARLRLLAAIADAGEGGCGVDALRVAEIPEKQLRRHLGRLAQAGLVEADGPLVVARLERMQQAQDAPDAGRDVPTDVAAYFRRGRLVDVPRAPEVRRRVLVEIARRFDEQRSYSEPEINTALNEVHDDHAALRRYMVDFGILERDVRGTSYRLVAPPA